MNPKKAKRPVPQASRRSRYFYIIIILVITANLVALLYLHRYQNSQQQASTLKAVPSSVGEFSRFGAGELLPVFYADSIKGGAVGSKDYQAKWLLVLYLGSKLNAGVLTYCQSLFEQHRNLGLQPLAITSESPESVGRLIADEGISFPILFDNRKPLRETFRLTDDGVCMFLVDPSGNIKFSATHIPPQDSIRQLVERYILGSINYKESVTRNIKLKPGDLIPLYTLRNVRLGAKLLLNQLDLKNASVVLFGAECSSCQVSRYLDAAERVSRNQRLGEKVYFVFNRNFSINEIADMLNSRSIGPSVYVAKDNLEAFGNPYAIKSTYGEEAIAITTNEKGRVKDIKPLTEWLTLREQGR